MSKYQIMMGNLIEMNRVAADNGFKRADQWQTMMNLTLALEDMTEFKSLNKQQRRAVRNLATDTCSVAYMRYQQCGGTDSRYWNSLVWLRQTQASESADFTQVAGVEPASWLFSPLHPLRYLVSRSDRTTLELLALDLQEDRIEMSEEGRSRKFVLAVIWWRSLTEIMPFIWKRLRRLLPFPKVRLNANIGVSEIDSDSSEG